MPSKAAQSKNKPAKSSPKTPANDYVAAGEKAFSEIEAQLLALPSDGLIAVNVDVQVGAVAALGVAHFVADDKALRARFEALAKVQEFDIEKLNALESIALAAWFARHMYLLASATHTEAQLPASLVTVATELRARMMRVVEYHLGDHAVAGPLVTAIRSGTGHMDLANDLIALARLYKTYIHLLSHDKKDYRAADRELAAKTGDQILRLLEGSTPEQQRWADRQARAWTLLNANYNEVYAAGRYLKRHDADVETAFPSLVAASRTAASSSIGQGKEEAAPAPEKAGGTDSP